ncbi:MAG: SoxR reducing system RseC family protein [Clostridiales bacterium]|nr:SoxR reducing system RseC family protein [Clostridiales bacterium]
MTEQGVVLSVNDKFAKVRVGRNSACASCGKCGMTEKQKHVDFLASNEVGAVEGDTVTLSIPETNSAKLALVAYCLPLIPALGLLFLAIGLKWADYLAAILFFAGLAVGFAVVAVIDKLRKHKWMETPVIEAVVGRTSNEYNIKEQKGEQNNV